MKKTGKIFVTMSYLSILLNNVAYASEATGEKTISFSGKPFLIGVAVLVIVLLLYLGYKMDSNDAGTPKISSKKEKQREKLIKKAEDLEQNSGTYEADDNIPYEADISNFTTSDFNEKVEYDEDEDSLFDISTKEEDVPILDENIGKVVDDEPITNNELEEVNDAEEPTESVETEPEDVGDVDEEPEPEPEETGEEFDVSVIDDLDDEETEVKEDDSKTSESTMLFDSSELAKASSGKDLEEEIDNLDDDLENIDEEVANALEEESKRDTFIDEIKNFKEPEETDFVGFSVAKPIKKEEVIKEEEKKEKEEAESAPISNVSTDNEFLSQMEANLEKSKEERNAKKAKTTSTSSAKNSTSKSKTYTKKSTTKKK